MSQNQLYKAAKEQAEYLYNSYPISLYTGIGAACLFQGYLGVNGIFLSFFTGIAASSINNAFPEKINPFLNIENECKIEKSDLLMEFIQNQFCVTMLGATIPATMAFFAASSSIMIAENIPYFAGEIAGKITNFTSDFH